MISICTDSIDEAQLVEDYPEVQARRTVRNNLFFAKHGKILLFPRRFKSPERYTNQQLAEFAAKVLSNEREET